MQQDKRGAGTPLGGAVLSSQLAQTLAEEMRSGSFAHAARLPAEVELAARMGVSRTVVRDALGELERAGYLRRVRNRNPDGRFAGTGWQFTGGPGRAFPAATISVPATWWSATRRRTCTSPCLYQAGLTVRCRPTTSM